MSETVSGVKTGAHAKWQRDGSVVASHSGHKKDRGVEFKFCHTDDQGNKEWVTCLATELSDSAKERGEHTGVTYISGRKKYRTGFGGRRRGRGTSESDDDDTDDSGYSSDRRPRQRQRSRRSRVVYDEERYDSDDRSSQLSDRESTSSSSNRTRGRGRSSRHRRPPRRHQTPAPRRRRYSESESSESSLSSSEPVQGEAPAIVNPYAKYRHTVYSKKAADDYTNAQSIQNWANGNPGLVSSANHWKKSLNDHLAPHGLATKIPELSKNFTACSLADKQAGGATVDNLRAFTDAALSEHNISLPDPMGWEKTIATFVPKVNADDFPQTEYESWLDGDMATREERAKEAKNWAGVMVGELTDTWLKDQDPATFDKTIERIVNTACQLTDRRRGKVPTASKLTDVLNTFIRDGGGTDEFSRADVRDMRSSIKSLNRRKKSILKGSLYPSLKKLVETAFTDLQSDRAHRSRRTTTRASRPRDRDTERSHVRFRTRSECSRRRSSRKTPRRRNSTGTAYTGRSTRRRTQASHHRSGYRRPSYEADFSDEYTSDSLSTDDSRSRMTKLRDGFRSFGRRMSGRGQNRSD